MEAHLARCACLVATLFSLGASYRTGNFVVNAPTADMAQQIGVAAEKYRQELAIEWLGHKMPNWGQPCPITAQVAENLGAGGATSFVFEHGEVFGWRMTIQGSLARILDSVLPHEVTHTVFATHFRQPLPRWADEGACTTVEHSSERTKQQVMLVDFLRTGRGIAFSRMFAMKEYPRDVMPLYSQGYSVARYLVSQGGRRKFLDYLADGMRDDNWSRATQQFYGIGNLAMLQTSWLDWVRKGSPIFDATKPEPAVVAVKTSGANGRRSRPEANLIHRGQDADSLESDSTERASADTGAPSIYELASASKDSPRPAAIDRDNVWHVPRPGPSAAADEDQDESTGETKGNLEPAVQYQVTRPQPSQQAGQVILEWSRSEPTAETGVAAGPPGNRAAPSYH